MIQLRTITLESGDVDQLRIRYRGSDTRLLVYTAEDEPLTQARLNPDERRALAIALTQPDKMHLPLTTITIHIIPRQSCDDETYSQALAAFEDLSVRYRVEKLIQELIETREDLDGFRIVVTA